MRQVLSAAVIALSLAGILAVIAVQAVQHHQPRGYASVTAPMSGGAKLGSGLYEEPLSF